MQNNQNQNHQSIEEQVFILQEQARKSQTIQEELLAQQNTTQAMLAQLFNLMGNLQLQIIKQKQRRTRNQHKRTIRTTRTHTIPRTTETPSRSRAQRSGQAQATSLTLYHGRQASGTT